MRLEIHWFGKFPQFLLASKSPASYRGKAHWRQMNWPWIRDLVVQSDFDPSCAFIYALLNLVCVCEIFVLLEQRPGFMADVLFFSRGVFHPP